MEAEETGEVNSATGQSRFKRETKGGRKKTKIWKNGGWKIQNKKNKHRNGKNRNVIKNKRKKSKKEKRQRSRKNRKSHRGKQNKKTPKGRKENPDFLPATFANGWILELLGQEVQNVQMEQRWWLRISEFGVGFLFCILDFQEGC